MNESDDKNRGPRRTAYSKRGGSWTKIIYQPQCPHADVFLRRCQGTEGHGGDHWCFTPDGSLVLAHPPGSEVAVTSCPPGGAKYKSPAEMRPLYHMNFFAREEVTDPEELKRLEAGKIRPGESLNRPLNPREYEKYEGKISAPEIPVVPTLPTGFVVGTRWRVRAANDAEKFELYSAEYAAAHRTWCESKNIPYREVPVTTPGLVFDEVVIDAWLHVEQMDGDHWWLRVGDASIQVRVGPDGKAAGVLIERGQY